MILPIKYAVYHHVTFSVKPKTDEQWEVRRPPAYPFVGDDLVGPLLQLVQTQSTQGGRSLQGFGLLAGHGGAWSGTCCSGVGGGGGASSGGDVIEVQVLLTGQVLLLQGLEQHIRVVPDLPRGITGDE